MSSAPGVWVNIVGMPEAYLGLTYTKAGLTAGTDYKFRVRASNSFGWGSFSDEVTIRADEVPAQITPVITTADSIYCKIAWNVPSTDNGSPILEYRL